MKPHTQKYHIFWQKWEDPLTQMKKQISNHNRTQNLGSLDWGNEDVDELPMNQMQAMPLISTPMGLMPAPVPDMSAFNFWIGHTNFNITLPIWRIVNTSLGVETLDVFSPYRFRIAIGAAFNQNTVKINVGASIKKYLKKYAKATNSRPKTG